MIVHALRGCGLDPSYVVGGELRVDRLERRLGQRRVDRDRGRRIRPLAAQARPRRSPCSPTPSSIITRPTASRLDLEQTFRTFMARAGDRRRRLGSPGAAGPVPARRGGPYDAPEPRARVRTGRASPGGGSRSRLRSPAPTTRSTPQARSRACALAGRRPRPARQRRCTSFRGARRRFELLGHDRVRGAGLRRLRPPPDRGRGGDRGGPHARARGAWSRSSSHTCTRAPARSRASSAGALAGRRRLAVLTCTRRASGPRTSRASTGCWSPRAAADAAAAGRWRGCPRSTTPGGSWTATLRAGDLCLMMGAGNIDSLGHARSA